MESGKVQLPRRPDTLTVRNWVDSARGLFANQVQLPLIDDSNIDMESELGRARVYYDHYESLAKAIDKVLSRDPDDLAVRFVALNAYYRLVTMEVPDDEIRSYNLDPVDPESLTDHLGYLVRLRDPADCLNAINVRWEIVNASAVKDYSRVLALCDQLNGIVADGERYYLHGRTHFLIALCHTWDLEEEPLELWDLPVGPEPDGLRGLWRWINAGILASASIQKFPTRGVLTDDDQDHLRDAVKFFEKAIKSEWNTPATARFMLARSYASIGDGGNAARQYQWMLDHREAFFQSWNDEMGQLRQADSFQETFRSYNETLLSGIHSCLVNAYDDAGDVEKAIAAAEAWIETCPDHLGTFERMARLQQKRADPIAAAEYIRKEVDRNSALGEDPNVSIILALGGIVSNARLDETLKNIASTHSHEHALIEAVVKNYWPAFVSLNSNDQQRWVTGTWLLGAKTPQGPGIAVHCFARIVEGELRTRIFGPFAEYAQSRQEIMASCADDIFSRYLRANDKNFGLGQMLKLLGFARRPHSPLTTSFAEWIERDHPRLLAGLAAVRTDMIAAFRNREDHADVRLIAPYEAEEASKTCRKIINLLHRC